MKTRYAVFMLWTILVIIPNVRSVWAQNTDVYVVSIPVTHLNMSSEDRITNYRVTVRAGHISGLLKIPMGWIITINDNLSKDTILDGIASHGVAYMTFDDVVNGALESFMIIKKDRYLSEAEVLLSIEVRLTIWSMLKSAHRDVVLNMSNLLLAPYSQ